MTHEEEMQIIADNDAFGLENERLRLALSNIMGLTTTMVMSEQAAKAIFDECERALRPSDAENKR